MIRNILLLAFLLFSGTGYAQYFHFHYDGHQRSYLLHLPAEYNDQDTLPLVIALHGGGGNAWTIRHKSQLDPKADTENFIVVYPEGIKGGISNIRTWNAGWCCGYASNAQIDDVGFIDTLIQILSQNYPVDRSRIFVTGMSNGGFMAYRLACELSSKIAAIAPVACSMSINNCSPEYPVSIIHFHSYQDANIPYNGGIGNGLSHHYNPPLDSVFNAWAVHDSCVTFNDTVVNNSEYTLVKWNGCHCKTEIHYYITQDGGHAWPGNGGPEYIHATDLMWDFFKSHPSVCQINNISHNHIDTSFFKFYPNPVFNKLNIECSGNVSDYFIEVYNSSGLKWKVFKNPTTLNLTPLTPGLYFLKIKSGDQVSGVKIIKAGN